MSAARDFDVIVIGAGHNGLAAAATLARKGRRVCVLERSDTLGGMAGNFSPAKGVTAPRMAHLLYNLNPKVARDLGLGERIPLKTLALPSVALSPDGNHVVVEAGKARFADGRAHPDAAAFAALHDRLTRFAGLLAKMSENPPPGLQGSLLDPAKLGELIRLARLGLGLKRLGKVEMREFLRILMSNAHDLLLDEMGDGPLAGLLAADAVRGAFAGPRSPGTVFTLMYRMGNGGNVALPVGGMGAVAEAFASAARAVGCDIRLGNGVAGIEVADDRAVGVLLDDGTRLGAGAILSSAGPMPTLKLAGIRHFDTEAVRRLRHHRCKGSVAKINLVLSGVPAIPGLPVDLNRGRLVIAPSVEYVERAFNPAKYGEMPTAPSIELLLPCLSDPSLASDGRQVASAIVNFVPPAPDGGWTKARRNALLKTVLGVLEQYAPGLSGLVTQSETLVPPDIEALTGAPGGHWHHGEMGFDQVLTNRPANGMARYRFGVNGLYLCGAAAHPGGDVTGAPGRNAALQLLRDGVA
ncbi:MAG: NAD(P)/FAD-dependent oxidoreductase [Rhodobacteraceae bacterium]|nr:NAD(P)/FAD-dependent oxidoreductase [Paracoccaceae bacterium]